MEPTDTSDFRHGYAGGQDGVSRETYEGYLSSRVSADWLSDRITEKEAYLRALDAQITTTTDARQRTHADWQARTVRVAQLERQLARLNNDRQTAETERTALRERRSQAAPEYSLLAGLLFLAAGVSFLAGDLIISHEIVAYALNIRNPTEAWAFAVGLAMVSILLKPAYDRLVEGPYRQDPARYGHRYARFKLMLSGFALLTLLVLGWFRYEAYRTDQLKAAINKAIRQMQQNAVAPDGTATLPDGATLARMEKQLAESSELNLQLVNSPWALLSFVLSGVLFALAGAVCLGIALPVLTAFWFRWLQAGPRLVRLRRRIRRLTKPLAPVEDELTAQRGEQATLQYRLDLLPDLDALRIERRQTTAERDDLLAELKLALTDSRIHNFNDGYDRGEAAHSAPTPPLLRSVSAEVLNGNGLATDPGRNGG